MRIAIVGTGRVGLVTGVCLASLGHEVTGVDASAETIELLRQGRCSFFEPGLQELLEEQVAARRMVEETEHRLGEALSILRTLEERSTAEPVDHASWTARVDEAIGHLALVRSILHAVLSEDRFPDR